MMNFNHVKELVALATRKEGGQFYRHLYGIRSDASPIQINSPEDWETLPLLTKDDLIAVPLRDRSFLPMSKVDHLRPSSGTSGKGPLFSPRTYLREMDYRLAYHDFKRPIVSYTVPMMPHWHEQFQQAHGIASCSISFDPKNPAACARLARIVGADALSFFAFHVPLIAPHLVHEGIAERIRFIEIAGEACTRALFEFMRETFPHAIILPFYGSSEAEDSPIGMPCRPITGEMPLALYHGKPSHYHEIIDPDTLKVIEPLPDAEGELVMTAYPGEPSSFPLIRFRTGDTVRVMEKECAAHGTWSFTVLGRTQMDFIKIQGGVLRADEIARVLRTMQDDVTDRYELHCTDESGPQGPLFTPILRIETKRPLDIVKIAERIARSLRVSPTMTYADGAAQGRYAQLVCEEFHPLQGAKSKRIVRH